MLYQNVTSQRRVIILLALICYVAQIGLAPYIVLGEGHINFALIFAGIVSLFCSPRRAIVLSCVAGVIFEVYAHTPIGIFSCVLSIFSFFMSTFRRSQPNDSLTLTSVVFMAGAFCATFAYLVIMSLLGLVPSFFSALIMRCFPVFILSSLAYIPLLYFVRSRTTFSDDSRRSPAESLASHVFSSIATTFSPKHGSNHMPAHHNKLKMSKRPSHMLRR